MTYSPEPRFDRTMPTQTRCDRVPPHYSSGLDEAGLTRCLDLTKIPQDGLPLDPRSWGRGQVGEWVARAGGPPERFPMNGKGLCLMSREMFCARVPALGHKLHREFRGRLARAMALQQWLETMAAGK